VFATQIGTPLSRHNLTQRSFKPLLREAGVTQIRFHDLRHTCATILLKAGQHPKRTAKKLGKVDPAEGLFGNKFEKMVDYVSSELEELLILDVAHRQIGSGKPVLPDRVEPLLLRGGNAKGLKFDSKRISYLCYDARQGVPHEIVNEARYLVKHSVSTTASLILYQATSLLVYLGVLSIQRWNKQPKRNPR